MENARILVIDDEKNILESVRMVLSYEDYAVETAASGIDGLELFKQIRPEIVLLDVKMPGFDGLQVLKTIKQTDPLTEVIMISGHSGIEEAMEASRIGAFDFLEKPISREKLLLSVRNAAEKYSLTRENATLRTFQERKHDLVGDSPVMQKLKQVIDKVARTQSTVLITGESGTGKELIARRLHYCSQRSKRPFVQVNCAAIPEELIESELFGHEKGSFTGAFEKKPGKFEIAHRGTIFLDEIGDLSLKAQAKVLRVLEEGEIQRVGSAEIQKVDVRVIAATNQDLKQKIRDGEFREDLFFRLNVVPVYSPALRERVEDIPRLVDHFVGFFAEENNYRKRRFDPAVIEAFSQYPWKGNVRELRNLVERLLIMTDSRTITIRDLPEEMRDVPEKVTFSFARFSEWKEFKEFTEKRFLEEKLEQFDHNISRTAREIGIPRSNLYKKMEQFAIIVPNETKAAGEPPSGDALHPRGEESPDSAGKDGS